MQDGWGIVRSHGILCLQIVEADGILCCVSVHDKMELTPRRNSGIALYNLQDKCLFRKTKMNTLNINKFSFVQMMNDRNGKHLFQP